MNLFIMLNMSSKIFEHPKLIVILTYKSLSSCFSFLLLFSFVKIFLAKKWCVENKLSPNFFLAMKCLIKNMVWGMDPRVPRQIQVQEVILKKVPWVFKKTLKPNGFQINITKHRGGVA